MFHLLIAFCIAQDRSVTLCPFTLRKVVLFFCSFESFESLDIFMYDIINEHPMNNRN